MAAKLTDFEKMIVKKIFDKFDADKNEEITAEEIKTKYNEMGRPLSDLEIVNIIGKMDTNSSDTIDFDEYCEYWTPDKDPETKRAELTQQFQVHDRNDDGFIDVDEFLQIVHSIGFPDINRERAVTMIAKVDSDGDGKINLEEFLKTSDK